MQLIWSTHRFRVRPERRHAASLAQVPNVDFRILAAREQQLARVFEAEIIYKALGFECHYLSHAAAHLGEFDGFVLPGRCDDVFW